MHVYLSTSCYGKRPLKNAIELCKKIEPNNIEISAPHDHQPIEEIVNIIKDYKKEGVNFTLHNYFPVPKKSFVLNIASEDEECQNSSYDLIKNALYLAEIANSPLYGVHAGYLKNAKSNKEGQFIFDSGGSNYNKSLKRAVEFVCKISKDFERTNTSLIIENLFPSPKKRHSLNCSYEEIYEYFSFLPENIGLLLDLGHLNVSSVILDFNREDAFYKILKNFSNRILEVHISENNGLKDEHLPVKKNSWQLNAIKEIKKATSNNKKKVIYCIEARNAEEYELKDSVYLINNVLGQ